MSEISEAERLFQQLGGNTPEEDLSHLKVYIQGDDDRGEEIIDYLLSLDSRVKNTYYFDGDSEDNYYFIDIENDFEIIFEDAGDIPSGYRLLHIEDILDDEIEEENVDDNDEEEEYCTACGEVLDDDNETRYYSDGEECCQSCYDIYMDDLEDDEEDGSTQSSDNDIDKAEILYKQLSETKSIPKDIIDVKLSELSKISKRRR